MNACCPSGCFSGELVVWRMVALSTNRNVEAHYELCSHCQTLLLIVARGIRMGFLFRIQKSALRNTLLYYHAM